MPDRKPLLNEPRIILTMYLEIGPLAMALSKTRGKNFEWAVANHPSRDSL